MDHLRKSDLRSLLEHVGLPRLSLYMPTHRARSEQDPIRYKNLLDQAEQRLSDYGLRWPEVQEFLEPARNQPGRDGTFWQQGDGLALFMAPNLLQYYRLPVDFEETLMLGDQFHLKPLFKIFQNSGQFYILALSQNEVRLLEGTKYGVEEVELERLPASLVEALKWDNPERQTHGHTVSGGQQGGGRGRPDRTFHDHGVGKDDEKTDFLRYFREEDLLNTAAVYAFQNDAALYVVDPSDNEMPDKTPSQPCFGIEFYCHCESARSNLILCF